MTIPHNHVAIIGTGFGGIATAVRLQKAGVDDFVLIDRAGEVGGVWRDNDYPGAAVDVQSHLYSLSFAPNPDWRSTFAKQPELHAYLRRVTDRFDLRRRLELDCTVEALRWEPTEQRWTLETSRGRRTAQHVVVATGALAEPVIPDLPGLGAFEGAATAFAPDTPVPEQFVADLRTTGRRRLVAASRAIDTYLAEAPLAHRLTASGVPAELTFGELDARIAPPPSNTLSPRDVMLLTGVGHTPPWEAPDRTAQLITTSLTNDGERWT
jgi:glycine/D-amino acid oxidase-like deaminating enzyme